MINEGSDVIQQLQKMEARLTTVTLALVALYSTAPESAKTDFHAMVDQAADYGLARPMTDEQIALLQQLAHQISPR